MADEKVMLFIVYDRAIDEEVLELLKGEDIQYYTRWLGVTGVGRHDPHLGDHVWPGLNNVIMTLVPKEKEDIILSDVSNLQNRFPSVGLRAFVVPVLHAV